MLTLSLSRGLTNQLLRSGAVHRAERPGSDYRHFLAYLKTPQDIQSGTSRAVHVAVTKPQNFADIEKSELFPRRLDEKGWLFPKVDLTEAETDLELKSDNEEAEHSGTFASSNVGLDEAYADYGKGAASKAPQGFLTAEGKESPRKDSLAIGGKDGKKRADDAADDKT